MGAVIAGGVGRVDPSKKKKDPMASMYDLYESSVERQAGDYDDIMGRFRSIYGGASNPNSSQYRFDPVRAEQTSYNQSRDTTEALRNLEELSRTGGLDDAAQQNLRARGISPIRAQYATASRDMDRQRRLQGGNSANFGAVTAKMARDQSSLIADQMDKVNAGIAEMVQSGRLSAAPNYASAASSESDRRVRVDTDNTRHRSEANQFNARGMFEARGRATGDRLGAAQGMNNLYGTTPALSNLYGNQAHRTAEFQDNVNQRKKKSALSAFSSVYR